MKLRTSVTLPELTLQQLEDLKKFYKDPEVLGDSFSVSRLIIICVNYFWKHIFEDDHDFNNVTSKILQNRTNV